MSPRHQISSGAAASISTSTASSAARFPWMSEMTATRTRGTVAVAVSARLTVRSVVGRVDGGLVVLLVAVLGEVLDPLVRGPLGVVVLHRVDQLAHEAR